MARVRVNTKALSSPHSGRNPHPTPAHPRPRALSSRRPQAGRLPVQAAGRRRERLGHTLVVQTRVALQHDQVTRTLRLSKYSCVISPRSDSAPLFLSHASLCGGHGGMWCPRSYWGGDDLKRRANEVRAPEFIALVTPDLSSYSLDCIRLHWCLLTPQGRINQGAHTSCWGTRWCLRPEVTYVFRNCPS